MKMALLVTLTILAILTTGYVVAVSATKVNAELELCGFILLAAALVVVHEWITLRKGAKELRRSNDPFGGAAEWFAGSPVDVPDFHSRSPRLYVLPRASNARNFERAAAGPRLVPRASKRSGRGDFDAEDSVEQIAQEMVTQAFRQISRKYHPDHGGDQEMMRRVYEAREMMLRAIRKG